MSKRPGSSNMLRLVGGKHGGRKLRFPDAQGLRPTADRVRETLFNWLMPHIDGSACLDVFAGSGALGFEAVSRGASKVVMLEQSAAAFKQLQGNAALLNEQESIDIIHANALSWLENPQVKHFDVIFLDPPFKDQLLDKVVKLIGASELVKSSTHVYIERDVKQALPAMPHNWSVIRDKKAGQVAFSLVKCD